MSKTEDQESKKIEAWLRSKNPEAVLGFAREMRKNPTEAEQLLWKELRGRKLSNLKFRRQQPMQGYILDFYCESARLGVEVDGEIHTMEEQTKYGQQRSAYLEEYGIKIIRFRNDKIINEMKYVLNAINESANQRK